MIIKKTDEHTQIFELTIPNKFTFLMKEFGSTKVVSRETPEKYSDLIASTKKIFSDSMVAIDSGKHKIIAYDFKPIFDDLYMYIQGYRKVCSKPENTGAYIIIDFSKGAVYRAVIGLHYLVKLADIKGVAGIDGSVRFDDGIHYCDAWRAYPEKTFLQILKTFRRADSISYVWNIPLEPTIIFGRSKSGLLRFAYSCFGAPYMNLNTWGVSVDDNGFPVVYDPKREDSVNTLKLA